MGVSTVIDIQINYKSKDEDKLFDIVHNFREDIKEHICKDKPFHAESPEVMNEDDELVELQIYSSRTQNAHWQMNCLIRLLQIHGVTVYEFSAEENQPTNVAFIEEEDFDNYEVDLT